jgi:hypothetical protein
MRPKPFITGIVIIAAVVAAPATAQQNPVLSPPSGQVYLGVRVDPGAGTLLERQEQEELNMETLEGPAPLGINRIFALHLSYYDWTELAQELDSSGIFQPDSELKGDINRGRIPVISWKCDDSSFNTDEKIATGDPAEDANIVATAKALAQYPGPVLLRWFWKFNVLDNTNRQLCRGDEGTPTPKVYADFIAAWQQIRQLFR